MCLGVLILEIVLAGGSFCWVLLTRAPGRRIENPCVSSIPPRATKMYKTTLGWFFFVTSFIHIPSLKVQRYKYMNSHQIYQKKLANYEKNFRGGNNYFVKFLLRDCVC
jgi:hypothetical protein